MAIVSFERKLILRADNTWLVTETTEEVMEAVEASGPLWGVFVVTPLNIVHGPNLIDEDGNLYIDGDTIPLGNA